MKRALVFLAITFGITYAYDFLVVYPIAEGIAAMCAWCTVLAKIGRASCRERV